MSYIACLHWNPIFENIYPAFLKPDSALSKLSINLKVFTIMGKFWNERMGGKILDRGHWNVSSQRPFDVLGGNQQIAWP